MTDTIRIDRLKVQTNIGVSDEERASLRSIVIDSSIAADNRLAGMSDDLAGHGRLRGRHQAGFGGDRRRGFRLIEHFAERVAAVLLQETEANSVKVEIIKAAPSRRGRESGIRDHRT